jgi:hypothetical protein
VVGADQLRGHKGKKQKAAVLARCKGNNARRPLFFSACVVGMALANSISALET